MKQQILNKIRECCPELVELSDNIFHTAHQEGAVLHPPQLQHLLRAMQEHVNGKYALDTLGYFWAVEGNGEVATVPAQARYDLTLSVEENLNNKDLCTFLSEILL